MREIQERSEGSSRPRNANSMRDTTSGTLARKQMMVSTGTYCGLQVYHEFSRGKHIGACPKQMMVSTSTYKNQSLAKSFRNNTSQYG